MSEYRCFNCGAAVEEVERLERARDEARRMLELVTAAREEARSERDEARAIARRLVNVLRAICDDLYDVPREAIHAMDAFDALPWAKEPA